MPNYKQTNIAGEKYQRACRVVAENPLGATPSITFIEEKVIVDDVETIRIPCGTVGKALTTPEAEFNLLNPLTDEIIGTAKHQDIYVLLYSFYRSIAAERDNA